MKDKIRQHFNHLFGGAPNTRKALDLKQEMIQNAMDKYDDMVAEGYSEEDAYRNVIESIGDVRELFSEVEDKNLLTLPEKDRRKRAVLKAVSVGMYIFAGVVFFGFSLLNGMMFMKGIDITSIGFFVALLICIPPTVMLVYAANMYPGYTKKDGYDMVEEYKEVRYNSNRNKAVEKSVNTIIWTLAVALFFIVSFRTNEWEVTWVIFPIALCIQAVVRLVRSLREDDVRK